MRHLPLLRIILPALVLAAAPAAAQQALHARVDSVFARFDKPDSPGCAVGIYRDGEIEYAHGYGMANLELGVPITPQTVFDIGSTSKQFTAASIVLLAQQGRLSLDDDVRKHIPELPDFGETITIRHLLHHTSGLRDYIGLMVMAGHDIDDVTTAQTALDILARQKALNFKPGDEHLYSNSGYFLASLIVERASGMPMRRFAQENLFAPLGMEHTLFRDDHTELVPHRATAYAPRERGGYRMDVSNWEQLGDGAVFTTVEDLLLWDRNFYDPRVGGASMLTTMQTPGTLNGGAPLTYALGLGVTDWRGLRMVSHSGAWGGYRAELMRLPTERFSVATLCNLATTNPSGLARQVAEIYLADKLAAPAVRPGAAPASAAAPAVTVDAAALRRFAGTYRDSVGDLRVFREEDGKLVMDAYGDPYEMRPVSATEFQMAGGPRWNFRFETAATGRPVVRQIAPPGESIFRLLTLAVPTAGELQAYAGAFYSEELDATFTVTADSVLTLHRRGAEPLPLQPLERDEFFGEGVTFRFSRGADGRITGFALDQGRIRNLGFVRVEPRAPR
jgi:CubicO group peptidase (beta-lactamase class C family)